MRKKPGKPVQHRQGKKNRKFGRNKVKCAAYKAARKHEKSHIRRIERHIVKYKDESEGTANALRRYKEALGSRP